MTDSTKETGRKTWARPTLHRMDAADAQNAGMGGGDGMVGKLS